jgi:hypothetical protein
VPRQGISRGQTSFTTRDITPLTLQVSDNLQQDVPASASEPPLYLGSGAQSEEKVKNRSLQFSLLPDVIYFASRIKDHPQACVAPLYRSRNRGRTLH